MKKHHLPVAGAALLGLVLTGCSGPGGASSAFGNCEEIRIGTGPAAYGPYLPLYVADQEGYFTDRGINAVITEYGGGGAAAEGVAAGEADLISWAPVGLVSGMANGLELTIVATGMPTATGWYVLVPQDSPVQSLSDLDGRQVGIGGPGGSGEQFALWAESESGGEWDLVSLGYGTLNQNMVQETVSAIVQLPPLSYAPVVDGSGRIVSDIGAEMEPIISDAWIASTHYQENCGDTIQLALDALFEGTERLQGDREYALEMIEEHLGVSGEVAEMEYENTIMSLSADGSFEHQWVENGLEFATSILDGQGLALPTADEMYTDQFVTVRR